MKILLHHTYFPNLAHSALMVKAQDVWFEVWDNYDKQTYRNRCYIYGDNGIQNLSIPVFYTQKNRQLYSSVEIANTSNWQDVHWKSIESAYRSSPFFEFYEDELRPLFETKYDLLLDFNKACLEVVKSCLQLEFTCKETSAFEKQTKLEDFRKLVNINTPVKSFESYTHVSDEKHGFLSNLSILDLLFNEGPNSINYLLQQEMVMEQ